MNQGSSDATTEARPRGAAGRAEVNFRLTILTGDDQTAALVMTDLGFPMATFEPITAELRDAGGAVLPGEPVAWSVGETPANMGVQMDPMGTAPCIVVTDERGVATLDKMRGKAASAFYDYGPFTLVASHEGASAAANLTVATPVAIVPAIVSGDNQSVARSGDAVPGGEAVFAPVTILMKDTQRRPVPGVRVSLEAIGPKGMTIRLSPEGATAVVVSDAEGLVTLDWMGGNSMVCTGGAGEFKIMVTPDDTKPVVSHHTVAS